MIKWVNMTDFAKALGVCKNTFKKYYLDLIPPQRQNGNRVYWTQETVTKTVEQVKAGELVA